MVSCQPKYEAYIGKEVNGLKILALYRKGRFYFFTIKCHCGKVADKNAYNLLNGKPKSCGCQFHRESKNPTLTYRSFLAMRERCNNPNNPAYSSYGGRGITICPEWATYQAFLADMGERPSSRHSLDRVKVNEGYSKSNCRWATDAEQMANKRNNVHLEYKGQVRVMAEWSRIIELDNTTIRYYLKRGKSFEWIYDFAADRKKHREFTLGKDTSEPPTPAIEGNNYDKIISIMDIRAKQINKKPGYAHAGKTIQKAINALKDYFPTNYFDKL